MHFETMRQIVDPYEDILTKKMIGSHPKKHHKFIDILDFKVDRFNEHASVVEFFFSRMLEGKSNKHQPAL